MADANPIRKVAVIGAGVMGAGIAAQVANAGVPVLLLDIVPKAREGEASPRDGNNRNAIAEGAVAKMLKTQPAPFMSKSAAKLVETGNIEDDLGKLAEVDWVVEAVIERLDIKRDLYKRIDAVRRPGTAISSNTSTIPLKDLVDGQSDAFARDFMITHFFNPPRYMRLLELVGGEKTDPALLARVAGFADATLGKSIVRCKDSPGFIANRLGTYWISLAIKTAIDQGLTPEEADAVSGAPFGVPKTGVFGLTDLVGLDLMPHINKSMRSLLKPGDWFFDVSEDNALTAGMIERGLTGRKGKGGFFRVSKGPDGRKLSETIDLATGDYRPTKPAQLPELAATRGDIRALMSSDTKAGRYAWAVFGRVFAYAASLVPEAAETVVSIDEAMRLGYNWKHGPFELIDQVGADWLVDRLQAEGIAVPPLLDLARGRTFYRREADGDLFLGRDGAYHRIERPEGVLLLADIKRTAKPVLKNAGAALWEIGDGVVCFEITAKAAALDEQVLALLDKTIDLVPGKYKALVVYHEGKNFSVGANLGAVIYGANIAAWDDLSKMIAAGQKTYSRLKFASFPTVSAPFGMALGGGCEILLHSSAIQAHAETYTGLVEGGVGLIPGWGGCKEMLLRWSGRKGGPGGPMPGTAKAFELIGTAKVSTSAAEARELGILREGDGITMNRDRLLADAKARALALAEGYQPPAPRELRLPGPSGKLALELALRGMAAMKQATPHDVTVGLELAGILTGGETDIIDPVSEDRVMELEREAFIRLLKTKPTLARIEHMLETGKPLRN